MFASDELCYLTISQAADLIHTSVAGEAGDAGVVPASEMAGRAIEKFL